MLVFLACASDTSNFGAVGSSNLDAVGTSNLDALVLSVEVRDAGGECTTCDLATTTTYAGVVSNESEEDAVFTTATQCLNAAGALECGGPSTTGWTDFCPSDETRWVVPAHDQIEQVGSFEWLSLAAGACELSLTFDLFDFHEASVSFVVE